LTATARKEAGQRLRRQARGLAEELRFIPVPNANTRVEGALSGQYHFADLLPTDALAAWKNPAAAPPCPSRAVFGFPYFVFNTREGVINAATGMRKAIQTSFGPGEMMAAGFGDTRFFTAEANHFPQGTPFYSAAGGENYNQRDAAKAKGLAGRRRLQGRDGRILTSRQYDFHYNMALVMAEQLKRAGFKAELNVVDWATLVQRRNDSKPGTST
jgi:peptide/nickel transport system substrate-binding protein